MLSVKSKVYFYENIGLAVLARNYLSKRTIFYSSLSLLVRLALKLFKLSLPGNVRGIAYGDLAKSTGIRKIAYEHALYELGKIKLDSFGFSFVAQTQINLELIAQKYFLDLLFKKYEFYGMAMQFVAEHDECSASITVDPLFFDEALVHGKSIKVVKSIIFYKLEFILSMLVQPLFLILFFRRKRVKNNVCLDNSIICEVDNHNTYNMFYDLFGENNNLKFVINPAYLKNFQQEEIKKLGLIIHGISSEDYRNLKKIKNIFRVMMSRSILKFSRYGGLMPSLFRVIANGVALTANARNSAYLTFEHMNTFKAARNELLRINGNRSIFVPYNAYSIGHFYVPEYQYNYDILCSPGKLLERVYLMQNARTQIFLRTGSYHPHKKNTKAKIDDRQTRVKNLLDFKSAMTVVTVLCNGVQDATHSDEVRLMALACRLSREMGVKVIVRQKPTNPPIKYVNFYTDAVFQDKDVLLTHSEYELFDFLEVTDLFITNRSSSALDLCIAGGQFLSIDFSDDAKDVFFWQTEVDGVLLKQETAFDSIMDWIHDLSGKQRSAHKNRMLELSGLAAYKFENFDSYKSNILMQLNPYLPSTIE